MFAVQVLTHVLLHPSSVDADYRTVLNSVVLLAVGVLLNSVMYAVTLADTLFLRMTSLSFFYSATINA